jgi:hypothetical protein
LIGRDLALGLGVARMPHREDIELREVLTLLRRVTMKPVVW